MRHKEEADRKARLDELKKKLENPLFCAANEQLAKQLTREVKEQEAEDRIRKYLRDENPGASFARVVLDTKVDMKIIEQLIADGRIDVKVNDKDWGVLEEEQKKLIGELTKTGKILTVQSKLAQEKQEENAVKMSGMYSQKERLKK